MSLGHRAAARRPRPPAAVVAWSSAPAGDGWRFFAAALARRQRLSDSFVRLTLTGPDLDRFADNGADQRFKLVLPDHLGGYGALPTGPNWYAAWRGLPPARQNPLRTYTVRAVRPGRREVDVDVVLHGDTGPASRFAGRAALGDPVVLIGPDAAHPGPHGGVEFAPPRGHQGPLLLVGDETAVPAVLAVLEGLGRDSSATGEAVLEVPHPSDILPVSSPPGVRVTWRVRGGGDSALPVAVAAALGRLGVLAGRDGDPPARTRSAHASLPGEAGADEVLWDVPGRDGPAAAPAEEGLYAWVAGEASLVRGLRRWLVGEAGVDRDRVAFMGYWRAEGARRPDRPSAAFSSA